MQSGVEYPNFVVCDPNPFSPTKVRSALKKGFVAWQILWQSLSFFKWPNTFSSGLKWPENCPWKVIKKISLNFFQFSQQIIKKLINFAFWKTQNPPIFIGLATYKKLRQKKQQDQEESQVNFQLQTDKVYIYI